jgi:hypothetical protein
MLRELAPLLAEAGINVDNIDVPDFDTLQRALNRAVGRRNLEVFSPPARCSTRCNPNRRTTRLPPSPAASASP